MKVRIAVTALAIVMVSLASASLAFAGLLPHEDPDAAPEVFDGVSLFRKYSETLDHVESRNAVGIQKLGEQAYWANVPSELKDTVKGFMSSSYSLAALLPTLDADVAAWKLTVAQFRLQDAQDISTPVARKMKEAYSRLREMEIAAQHTWSAWRSTSTTENSGINSVYIEVEGKLLRLRRELGLMSNVSLNLTQQNEAIAAIVSTQIEDLEGMLRPTSLTLTIEPAEAFVGDSVQFRGRLMSGDKPLSDRKVIVTLGGGLVSDVFTDSNGSYQGQTVLPYRYVPEAVLQAVYYPQGNDIGLYLGSSSLPATIKVLYYPAKLNLEAPGNGYPGRKLVLRGRLDYGNAPTLDGRTIQLSLDGRVAVQDTVAAAFSLNLPLPGETSLGKHKVMLYVPAQGVYAPASATVDVEVIKVVPVINFDAPNIVVLPFPIQVRGKVYSPLGSLQDVPLTIEIGGWSTSTSISEDGDFSASIPTGLSLTIVGSQALRVSVAPGEDWYEVGSMATSLLVINPVNVAGLVLVLVLPAFMFGGRQVRRRIAEVAVEGQPVAAPVQVKREIAPPAAAPALEPKDGSPGTILANIYRAVLLLVQRVTSIILRPNHTLREFARECAPTLGPLAGPFQEFTLMMERLLYSRNKAGPADAARGLELSRKLREETKGEGA